LYLDWYMCWRLYLDWYVCWRLYLDWYVCWRLYLDWYVCERLYLDWYVCERLYLDWYVCWRLYLDWYVCERLLWIRAFNTTLFLIKITSNLFQQRTYKWDVELIDLNHNRSLDSWNLQKLLILIRTGGFTDVLVEKKYKIQL